MKPLLAHVYKPHRVTYPCWVQPKLNGIRALYQGGHFQSRDEIPFPEGLLDHFILPLVQVFDPSVILDGELYVHGWPLQRINAAVTPVRQKPTEDTLIVEYHVFDQVDFTKPFQLRSPWFTSGQVKPVPTHYVESEEMADKLYAQWISEGYEGQMFRLGDCPYTQPKQHWAQEGRFWNVPKPRSNFLSDKNNRTFHLLKRKSWLDEDFLILGVEEGEGKRRGMVGNLVCQLPNGAVCRPGTGLTDAEATHFWENPPIGRRAKIKFLVYSAEGIPQNMSILAIL